MKKDISLTDDTISFMAQMMRNENISIHDNHRYNEGRVSESISVLELVNRVISNQLHLNRHHNNPLVDTISYNGNDLEVIRESSEFANYDHIKAEAIKEADITLKKQNAVWKVKVEEVDERIDEVIRTKNKIIDKQSIEHSDKLEELRLERIATSKEHKELVLSLNDSIEKAEQKYIDLKNNEEAVSLEDQLKEMKETLEVVKKHNENLLNRGFFSRLFNNNLT